MEQQLPAYPKFTKEMKRTHKILIPNMLPIHWTLLREALVDEGYQAEVLTTTGPEIAQEGLKYVHNDTCYPALLVIGQFICALKSGKYDLQHTALLITQTGGGCRASNYIHLLRKALVKAGFGNVPVASLNFSGLEKDSGFSLTVPLLRKVVSAVFYGDELMCLANQVRPYGANARRGRCRGGTAGCACWLPSMTTGAASQSGICAATLRLLRRILPLCPCTGARV